MSQTVASRLSHSLSLYLPGTGIWVCWVDLAGGGWSLVEGDWLHLDCLSLATPLFLAPHLETSASETRPTDAARFCGDHGQS